MSEVGEVMDLFKDVKSALRVSTDDEGIKTEIEDLIASAKEDLKSSGVKNEVVNDESNALVKRSIILFCKWQFGYDNPDSAKFETTYERLKVKLTLAEEYKAGEANER